MNLRYSVLDKPIKSLDKKEVVADVCIVLGVFNGAEHLESQINSLYAQTYHSWILLLRDDGSHDSSNIILKTKANQDSRIFLILDKKNNLGFTRNFGYLMEEAHKTSCRYIACSDQDDVWSPTKLENQLELMCETEKKYPNAPVLIYTDLEVVDVGLNLIHPSFMEYSGIHHEHLYPQKVLVTNNFVTGCTILINRRLLEIALPIPKEAIIHDWWLALCASVFGHIAYINKPLVKYRQHTKNAIGAKSFLHYVNPFKTNWYYHWLEGREVLCQSIDQARVLSKRIKEHDPSNPNRSLIEQYVSLQSLTPLNRVRALSRLGIHAQGSLRHAFLLSRLMGLPTHNRS